MYCDIWTTSVGKELLCQRERGNTHHPFAVAVVKDKVLEVSSFFTASLALVM